ncbi:hypothetical protein MPSEU_000698600 [Mayamaea pseudoterrestris]|nr:hypothetical protein MPSEU_000698600 [Mayamaea pseudoterrestris]
MKTNAAPRNRQVPVRTRSNDQLFGGQLGMLYGRQKPKPKVATIGKYLLPASLIVMTSLWLTFMFKKYRHIVETTHLSRDMTPLNPLSSLLSSSMPLPMSHPWRLPLAFDNVLYRAQEMAEMCRNMDANFSIFDKGISMPVSQNESLPSLPTFGILDDIQKYKQQGPSSSLVERSLFYQNAEKWQCSVPKWKECNEEAFTVVFMAYNPDRLRSCFTQIRKMLQDEDWQTIVEEVVLVWNGPRHIDESHVGVEMLEFAKNNSLRISYPLKMGFTNDLMNRYHPDVVNVTTKAILYYDDDGPFYSFKAVQAGFELWKRHSSAQIGAMARQISYGKRQQAERERLSPNPNDRLFVSHCDNMNDQVDYNFRYFANYDANMVLPSGSFLHVNYLCFLWHPVLEPIREFVRAHPVHPDDVTVSMIVSQLAGRAPRVYSRRLNLDPERTYDVVPDDTSNGTADAVQRHRDLLFDYSRVEQAEDIDHDIEQSIDSFTRNEQQAHRRLMFGIKWDAGSGMTHAKQRWADMRTEAINSLIRYFGSLNSGSIGWCEGTQWYDPNKDGKCEPVMAKQGWLPWMYPIGEPNEECP